MRGIAAVAGVGPIFVVVVVPLVITSTSIFCALPGRVVVAAHIGPILAAILVVVLAPIIVSATTNFGASRSPRVLGCPWISLPPLRSAMSVPIGGHLARGRLLIRLPNFSKLGTPQASPSRLVRLVRFILGVVIRWGGTG